MTQAQRYELMAQAAADAREAKAKGQEGLFSTCVRELQNLADCW